MNYYDEISEGYDELHREEQEKKLEIIKKHLKVRKTDRLLDVGCGSGLSSGFDCQVIGIDPSFKLLEKSFTNKVHGYGEYLPFKDDSFDIVVSITALQNFEDIELGLSEMKRVGMDRFVISFLRKSDKREKIMGLVMKYFTVEKVIDEEKDVILFLSI
tara:strand:- start:65 stop:538 length:474 start_codon:yes stop_codon:yes gene_type:complete